MVYVARNGYNEVIGVGSSNHAIEVILNLAWGPNNLSPGGFEFCRQGITLKLAWGPSNSSPGTLFFFGSLSFLFLYSFISCFFFPNLFYYLSYSERIDFTTLFSQSVYFSLFVGLKIN